MSNESGHVNDALDLKVGLVTKGRVEEEEEKKSEKDPLKGLDLLYGLEDAPAWYLCIALGFQHYLTMVGSSIAIPLIIAPALCVTSDVVKAELIGTIFFVSGLVTLLQAMFGVRLPIVQGGTFAFLTPTFAILALPQWKCPEIPVNGTGNASDSDAWMSRMNEIQGAIIGASLFEVAVGLSGLVGLLLRFIGPLAIAPTIALIGIALFGPAADFCAGNWPVAIMTMVFITLFSQYLRDVDLPWCSYSGGGCRRRGYPVFKLFPVILAILTSWAVCAILTAAGALPADPQHWAYAARTDANSAVLREAKWFRFPYPCQWGLPTFSLAAVFGMLAGVLAGAIESVGDYYACARMAGAPPPPVHAINRGVFVEGFGCVLAGLWGSGSGTTSYSENIGAIGITKVGSRRVILWGALTMMLLGILSKFGALFVTIPQPIIGGVFMVMFGMISAVGVSNLQFVDLNSSRNLFIFGFALFFGLSMPQWMARNPGIIQTGSEVGDQILTVLLTTSMFIGGVVGFILDNTVPGTEEERGIKYWRAALAADQSPEVQEKLKVYDLPFIGKYLQRCACSRYFPLCPTFDPSCSKAKAEGEDATYGQSLDGVKVDPGQTGAHQRKSKESTSM